MPYKIGIIHSGSSNPRQNAYLDALKEGLSWAGYNAGPGAKDVTFLPHFADDHPAQIDMDARNLVTVDNVDLLVAAGGPRACVAAKTATAAAAPNTPVVFTSVAESTRPAANMTGICARTSELDAQRLSVLHELLPGKTNFGGLFNSVRYNKTDQEGNLDDAALILGLNPLDRQEIDPRGGIANTDDLIGRAFQHWAVLPYQGVLVTADPVFNNHRPTLISAAAGRINVAGVAMNIAPIPAIYQWREFAEEGGLISYGPNLKVAYQLAGTYVGRVLDRIVAAAGAPVVVTDLPILPLNSFELVINLVTAKALRLVVPPSLLARADKIITS